MSYTVWLLTNHQHHFLPPTDFAFKEQKQVRSTMNVQKRNDVAIYCLSAGPTLPEWLGERAKRNLSKKDENVRRRIELIQDFQMPASSSKLVQSADGRYVMAAGTYPPRIRCYDLHDLTMKFERYVDAEVIDMVMLGEDYGKMALLLDNRYISFHAPYGNHEAIRIPTFGRAMAYESTTCELLLAAKGNQVYRINLEEGRFSEPWTFEPMTASASCITVNQSHPLATVGCDDGIVRFWDSRTPDSLLKPFLKLDVQSATAGYGYADENPYNANPSEITSIAHDPSGLYMAVGTGGGLVALYDVRSSRPLHIKEHKHGLPIHTVKFHSASGMVLSSDEKLVKVWRYKSSGDGMAPPNPNGANSDATDDTSLGSVKVNVEGTGKISHFIVAGDENDPTGDRSGVILCASDQPKMESYFIPSVGVAPKWCSFLENITEELEERDLNRDGTNAASDLVRDGQESIYENYKFVSRDDIEKLGISNLIGTPLLRGYMHGFFMDTNLYNRVKAVANPFEYEDYQKKKLKERLEAKRSSRIAPRESEKKTKAAVNPDLAARLEYKAADASRAGKAAGEMLSDNRFGGLFTNPDFHIDEEDEDFKLRNPSGVAAAKRKKNNLDSDEESESEIDERPDVPDEDEGFVSGDDKESADEFEEDDSASEEEDGFQGGKVRGEAYDAMKALKTKKSQKRPDPKKGKAKKGVMLEADDSAVNLGLGDESASTRAQRRMEEMNMPLAKRFALQKDDDKPQIRITGGSKEATFIPKDTKRKMEAEAKRNEESKQQQRGKRNRRGVKELGFKAPYQPQGK
jgi:ribosome biogenesis protein ENP2